jgi:dephospho-CoA kinase
VPYVIGVTGTIASGKSAVGKILSKLQVPVFDTDEIVHELLAEPTQTRKAVFERFGQSIADSNGSVNRRALGQIVFADESARRDLEAIVHPAVIAESRRRIDQLPNSAIAAVLAPLLFEAGLKNHYDETWSVYASGQSVKQRLMDRDKLSELEAERRLKAQWSQEKKAELADVKIDNSGTLEETEKQVEDRIHAVLAKIGSKSVY